VSDIRPQWLVIFVGEDSLTKPPPFKVSQMFFHVWKLYLRLAEIYSFHVGHILYMEHLCVILFGVRYSHYTA